MEFKFLMTDGIQVEMTSKSRCENIGPLSTEIEIYLQPFLDHRSLVQRGVSITNGRMDQLHI